MSQGEVIQQGPGEALRSDAFPHDRVVFFTDAVFAIAITLLVIEIHVPDREAMLELGLGRALLHLVPTLFAYVLSFMVIAQYWAAHLRTWKEVGIVRAGLLWLNVFQLMFVALMPFTTGLYAESVTSGREGVMQSAFVIYCLNMAAVSLFSLWQRNHVIRTEGLRQRLGAREISWMRIRAVIPLAVFLSCIPLGYLIPVRYAPIGFTLIFIVISVARRFHDRRPSPPEPAANNLADGQS